MRMVHGPTAKLVYSMPRNGNQTVSNYSRREILWLETAFKLYTKNDSIFITSGILNMENVPIYIFKICIKFTPNSTKIIQYSNRRKANRFSSGI